MEKMYRGISNKLTADANAVHTRDSATFRTIFNSFTYRLCDLRSLGQARKPKLKYFYYGLGCGKIPTPANNLTSYRRYDRRILTNFIFHGRFCCFGARRYKKRN
tara:strand:+ start:13215 stop:13526 length:312 start_codon:yes stop_codon:yes gene_type:complete